MQDKILVFGDFPTDWPYTNLILSKLSDKYQIYYCVPNKAIFSIKTFLNSFLPYHYVSRVITSLLFLQALRLKRGSFKFIFLGFGGFESIPIAFLVKKYLKSRLIYSSIVSKTVTNELYKESYLDIKKMASLEKMRFKLCDLVIFDTIFQMKFIVERLYGRSYDSLEKKDRDRYVYIPLVPDANKFSFSKPPTNEVLRVVWWGQASKLHGIEFIFHAINLCKDSPVKFIFIISEDIEVATGHDWNFWNQYLQGADVEIIKWAYGVSHTLDQINNIIQGCHICLGIFNFNYHLETFYANKEMEAIFLNRILVTRRRKNSDNFFNGAVVKQVETPQELALTLKNYIDCEVSVDNRQAIKRIECAFNSSIAKFFKDI
jgi:hypothetical protein